MTACKQPRCLYPNCLCEVTPDPRDAVLQAHTPALMVPRFGLIAPLDQPGHRYLVAQDGLWLEVKRPWLSALVPLTDLSEHQLPFGQVERRIEYAINDQDVAALQARFLIDAMNAMPNEAAAWGVYNERTRELSYRALIAIDAGPGGIEFHRPALAGHEHLAVDLHSHGAAAAFFSGTDDEDDAGEVKVSMVVGGLSTEPQWAQRLCLLGIFIGDHDYGMPVCRKCGCTDENACPGGCEWIEPDLCSRCK